MITLFSNANVGKVLQRDMTMFSKATLLEEEAYPCLSNIKF